MTTQRSPKLAHIKRDKNQVIQLSQVDYSLKRGKKYLEVTKRYKNEIQAFFGAIYTKDLPLWKQSSLSEKTPSHILAGAIIVNLHRFLADHTYDTFAQQTVRFATNYREQIKNGSGCAVSPESFWGYGLVRHENFRVYLDFRLRQVLNIIRYCRDIVLQGENAKLSEQRLKTLFDRHLDSFLENWLGYKWEGNKSPTLIMLAALAKQVQSLESSVEESARPDLSDHTVKREKLRVLVTCNFYAIRTSGRSLEALDERFDMLLKTDNLNDDTVACEQLVKEFKQEIQNEINKNLHELRCKLILTEAAQQGLLPPDEKVVAEHVESYLAERRLKQAKDTAFKDLSRESIDALVKQAEINAALDGVLDLISFSREMLQFLLDDALKSERVVPERYLERLRKLLQPKPDESVTEVKHEEVAKQNETVVQDVKAVQLVSSPIDVLGLFARPLVQREPLIDITAVVEQRESIPDVKSTVPVLKTAKSFSEAVNSVFHYASDVKIQKLKSNLQETSFALQLDLKSPNFTNDLVSLIESSTENDDIDVLNKQIKAAFDIDLIQEDWTDCFDRLQQESVDEASTEVPAELLVYDAEDIQKFMDHPVTHFRAKL